MRLGELAAKIGGVLHGDPDVEITGVAGVRDAGTGDLTFLADPRYEGAAAKTRAAAILVAANHRSFALPVIEHADPYRAFLAAVALLRPVPPQAPAGVHPTAVIGPGVRLGPEVSVGPHAVIEGEAEIGHDAVIGAGVFIGRRARVGAATMLFPKVVIREECVLGERVIIHSGTVIGSDGFGFLRDGPRLVKVPQRGRVVIGDDVEIGACCAIDRGTVGETVVGRGTKFDNLVHVGHNVRIGEDSIVVAQVGISGSATIGRNVVIAGQAGINGHIEIGDGAQVGAQSGVVGSLKPGARVWGTPALPYPRSKRVYAALRRAPELLRLVAELEKRVASLEAELGGDRRPVGAAPGARPSPRAQSSEES
jgi:UDP-3-O-[3-hydroxymyristoyl] glucosamine N-acyltransferase